MTKNPYEAQGNGKVYKTKAKGLTFLTKTVLLLLRPLRNYFLKDIRCTTSDLSQRHKPKRSEQEHVYLMYSNARLHVAKRCGKKIQEPDG